MNHCKKLKQLYLISNNIEKLPPKFCSLLTKLEQLHLSGNPIKELPNDIDKLTVLKVLGISFTKIEKLSRNIVELKDINRILVENTPLIV